MEALEGILPRELYDSLLRLDLPARIEELRKISLSTEVGPHLTIIQNALVDLTVQQR